MQNNKFTLILFIFLGINFYTSAAHAASAKPSLFSIEESWHDQNNKEFKFSQLKGKVTLLSMVYTSCDYTCPLITRKMLSIQSKIDKKLEDKVQFLLISFDPKRDTVETLKKFSLSQKIDESHVSLLTSNPSNTHLLSIALNFKYKEIEEGQFSHSNQITVLDKNGTIVYQKDFNSDIKELLDLIKSEAVK